MGRTLALGNSLALRAYAIDWWHCFTPLITLFEVKAYYLVGALLCVLALITLFAVPEQALLGGQPVTAPSVVLGFGAALILWVVGLGLWLLGRGLLASSKPTTAYVD